jgi:PIN domain
MARQHPQPPRRPTRPRVRGRVPPLRVVVDSNVFARSAWIAPIVESARAGVVQPLWSPCIIAEASRLLAWFYFKRNPTDISSRGWREAFSDKAKAWFAWVSEVFKVVEDRPPYELQWTGCPTDPWDQPVWTAAVRGQAFAVITENLSDGPPQDSRGIQQYRDIRYIHPRVFLAVMELWADLMWEGRFPLLESEEAEPIPLPEPPAEAESEAESTAPAEEIPPEFRRAIDEILERTDLPPAPEGEC